MGLPIIGLIFDVGSVGDGDGLSFENELDVLLVEVVLERIRREGVVQCYRLGFPRGT